jgi:hypothetical protein
MMEAKPERKSGHPSPLAGKCPKCKAPLYYASRIVSREGVFEEVDYCSGGCGFKRPAEDSEKPSDKESAE